jgi:5,10-methylenetetrahydrofolate reductase
VYDLDSTQLAQAINKMADQGIGLSGDPLDSAPDLFVGATAHPFMAPIELSLLQLKKKVLAGVSVVWTDPIFDVAAFEVWMQAVRASGLDQKVAIIASVLPLMSAEQAAMVRQKPAGKGITDVMVERLKQPTNGAGAGVAICTEIITALKGVAGVRGFHLLTGGREGVASQIMSSAHLA